MKFIKIALLLLIAAAVVNWTHGGTPTVIPVITVPNSQSIQISTATPITGISVADSNSGPPTISVTLSDSTGLLSATGTGVSGSGTTSLVINSTITNVNSALATLTDNNGTAGQDTIYVNAVDSLGHHAAQKTVSVYVNSGTAFNGGKTQLVLNFTLGAGDYAFINVLKSAQQWSYNSTAGACSNAAPTPDELNSDGYPVAGAKGIVSCSGYLTVFNVPKSSQLAGDYIVDWTGNCKLGIAASFSTVSGSGSVSNSYGTSPWRITLGANVSRIPFILSSSDGTCSNLRFYNINQQTALNGGEVFQPYFLQILKDARVGTIRFEDWQGDFGQYTNMTQWADNKPTSYVYYWGLEFRNSIYAGTTGSGGGCTENFVTTSDYCLTYGSGPPVDKEKIIINFDQNATTGTPLPTVTLNLNNTGAVRITGTSGKATNGGPGNGLYTTEAPITGREAALVYDAGLNVWMKYGGDAANNNGGLVNAVPPAIMIRLCNDIGAHCWINAPFLSLDPDSDYVTGLATLAKDTLSSGLKLLVEPPDETWNGVYPWTDYATGKAAVNWPLATDKSFNNEYGMWVSKIGQDVSAVYGGDTTKYSIEDCVWIIKAGTSDTTYRFTSPNYVTYNGGPPAYNYATNLCLTGYWYPGEFLTMQETIDAYNYVTAGSTVTQDALAKSFLDTALTTDGNYQFTIPSVNSIYAAFASQIAGFNSTYSKSIGMTQYEGGYNDSTSITANSGAASITSISSASSAVLTLGTGHYSSIVTYPMSAVVGMPVTVTGVTPSTFNGTYTVTDVGTGANINKVTINLDSTLLTYTSGGTMTYNGVSVPISSVSSNSSECGYVLSSPLTIYPGLSVTVSGATPAGYNVSQSVISTDPTGLNITTALNCTALGTISGTPVMTVSMFNAVQTLRMVAKFQSEIQSFATTNYTNFTNNGGIFPSTFDFSGGAWSGTSANSRSGPSIFANFQDIYATPSPQWLATAAWNGGTYP